MNLELTDYMAIKLGFSLAREMVEAHPIKSVMKRKAGDIREFIGMIPEQRRAWARSIVRKGIEIERSHK